MDRILDGERPTFTKELLPGYAELATACWATDPSARPSIQRVVKRLDILSQLHDQQQELKRSQLSRRVVAATTSPLPRRFVAEAVAAVNVTAVAVTEPLPVVRASSAIASSAASAVLAVGTNDSEDGRSGDVLQVRGVSSSLVPGLSVWGLTPPDVAAAGLGMGISSSSFTGPPSAAVTEKQEEEVNGGYSNLSQSTPAAGGIAVPPAAAAGGGIAAPAAAAGGVATPSAAAAGGGIAAPPAAVAPAAQAAVSPGKMKGQWLKWFKTGVAAVTPHARKSSLAAPDAATTPSAAPSNAKSPQVSRISFPGAVGRWVEGRGGSGLSGAVRSATIQAGIEGIASSLVGNPAPNAAAATAAAAEEEPFAGGWCQLHKYHHHHEQQQQQQQVEDKQGKGCFEGCKDEIGSCRDSGPSEDSLDQVAVVYDRGGYSGYW